ncbi:hypothetical protein PSV08DRAFT_242885 [Bipolaris maydis]|uniref:uncharacterized protein n=1 Tax=Cochliobolus heterostrophus TaxID=5016 RepID=UPI0024DA51FD|nr:hypothetical protein J3E73DRAFT_254420 [Bipolaris maydis]KAJ5061917.1 hypothetical protein J3E74DRAFT_289207 [Bipolaris maydis]KAJ6276037.1 hypothetical protein PSV08DRAFT_242885 [Bipolaris maydis]
MPALACLCQSRRGAWRSTHADAAPQTPAAHGHHGHENANGRCAHDACGHAPTPCPADDMCGSSLPPNRRPSESTSSRIPAEIALICSVHYQGREPALGTTLCICPVQDGSQASNPASRPATTPAACATHLHGHAYVGATTSIPAYLHHSTALVPTCHEAPSPPYAYYPAALHSLAASVYALHAYHSQPMRALGSQRHGRPCHNSPPPHPHVLVLVTTHCPLWPLTHAPFAATLAARSRRANALFS